MNSPELARELEECSRMLLETLRHRDPTYLGHLARRQQLLSEVRSLRMPEGVMPGIADKVRALLKQSQALGRLAEIEAAKLRREAAAELAALQGEQEVAEGLRRLSGRQYAMLDVRA